MINTSKPSDEPYQRFNQDGKAIEPYEEETKEAIEIEMNQCPIQQGQLIIENADYQLNQNQYENQFPQKQHKIDVMESDHAKLSKSQPFPFYNTSGDQDIEETKNYQPIREPFIKDDDITRQLESLERDIRKTLNQPGVNPKNCGEVFKQQSHNYFQFPKQIPEEEGRMQNIVKENLEEL